MPPQDSSRDLPGIQGYLGGVSWVGVLDWYRGEVSWWVSWGVCEVSGALEQCKDHPTHASHVARRKVAGALGPQ